MSYFEIFQTQITDLFRIGLILALLYTQARTAAATGLVVPLAAGLVFVAVLIPFTTGDPSLPKAAAVGIGLVSNALILAVALAAKTLLARRG